MASSPNELRQFGPCVTASPWLGSSPHVRPRTQKRSLGFPPFVTGAAVELPHTTVIQLRRRGKSS